MNIWEILDNPNSGDWLKSSVKRALSGNPEDALREAELLHRALKERAETLREVFHETERDQSDAWKYY